MTSSSMAEPALGPELHAKAAERAEALLTLRHFRLANYRPYPKQIAFHNLGATKHERLLLAGNQRGKTWCGAAELAMHATSLYAEWWEGYRYEHGGLFWVASVNGKKVRDNAQKKLMGKRGRWGTGFIPRTCILNEPIMAKGTSGLIDTVEIRHVASQTVSTIMFLSYDMDDDAWESDTVHGGWCDEEPPESKWSALAARLTATDGIAYITTTPLKGRSKVMKLFHPKPQGADRGFVQMFTKDVTHLPAGAADRIASRYASHQRRARSEGYPELGSGMIFEPEVTEVLCKSFEIPNHWKRIRGLDLGGGEAPTAWVELAIDPDTEVMYVVHAYKVVDPKISTHASALTRLRPWVPVAWPHDARTESRHDGTQYQQMYKNAGVNMLPMHAQWEDGSNHVDPGLSLMNQLFCEQKLRVFEHLQHWVEEYTTYHRVDGKINKEDDHLMDATRYAVMMRAWAKLPSPKLLMPETVGMDYDPLDD